MTRNSTFRLARFSWRPLVTVGCLLSFLVVSFAHAGYHLDKAQTSGNASVVLVASDDTDAADDETSAAPSADVCLCGSLLAANLPTAVFASSPAVQRQVVMRRQDALRSISPAAENPPPIG